MKPRVLQKGRLLPAMEKVLKEEFGAHMLTHEPDADAFLKQRGREFTALVTSARFGADDAMMAAMPSLKAICSFGVGYDMIDVPALTEAGVALAITPDGKKLYVANGHAGLSVYEITLPSSITSITRTTNQISVAWNGGPGLKLQRTTSLTNPNWTDVPGSEGKSQIQLPSDFGSEFYRLIKP